MIKILKVILMVILIFLLSGCSNSEISNIEINIDLSDVQMNEEPVIEEPIIEEPVIVEEPVIEDDADKILSKLTGKEITEEESKLRPIVVMLDNQLYARPQAGLSDAEVIYEILAEGTITRYMAVFQVTKPEVIGPIRSARPYFINRALEYNPLYVHFGGSNQAFLDIKNYQMADLDGLRAGVNAFYRTTHKSMPHNAYSSSDRLRNEADRKGYYTEVEFAGLPISNNVYKLEGNLGNDIKIIYKSPTSSDLVGYYIEFEYIDGKYERSVNGKKHLDEETEKQLYADNIIVQKVVHRVLDDAGRKELDMVSSGDGYYLNGGKYIKITWEKTSDRNQTKYYYEDGSELILNPGITWIQVIKSNSEPIIR